MKHWKSAVAMVVAATACSAGNAAAQIGFAVSAGPSFGMGSFGDAVGTGYHAQLSAHLSLPLLPISLRADGAWNSFPVTEVGEEDADFRILTGSVNAVFTIPSIGVSPYLIGGVGMYNTKEIDEHDHDATTDFGFNAGAGVRLGLPGLSVFAEARLHNIFTEAESTRFVPVSLGIRF